MKKQRTDVIPSDISVNKLLYFRRKRGKWKKKEEGEEGRERGRGRKKRQGGGVYSKKYYVRNPQILGDAWTPRLIEGF